jgi:hypothetical protein
MGGTICNCNSDEGKISTAILRLPWFIVNKILAACDEAERRKKSPPNAIEIFIAFQELGYDSFMTPVNDAYAVCGIIMSMLREHLIYTDKVAYLFSRVKYVGFYTYTEIFNMKYKGYGLAADQSLISLPGTKQVKFTEMWYVLVSKDRNLLE